MGGKRNGDPPHHRKTPRAQHNPSTPDGAQEGDHQGDAPTRTPGTGADLQKSQPAGGPAER
jgi:hypothetical protein